jgi:GNAT superfamily N-acetyltransferase
MIRPADPGDTATLVSLARDTGVFKPHDIQALQEVLDDYHATNRAAGHLAVVLEEGGELLGFAYYAPAAMTDGTWHLWWIAVRKEQQGRGLGTVLLRHVEEEVVRRRGRMLLIETSSLDSYRPTRTFYLKHAYKEVARLPDYYTAGDDMVIFCRRFAVS